MLFRVNHTRIEQVLIKGRGNAPSLLCLLGGWGFGGIVLVGIEVPVSGRGLVLIWLWSGPDLAVIWS